MGESGESSDSCKSDDTGESGYFDDSCESVIVICDVVLSPMVYNMLGLT